MSEMKQGMFNLVNWIGLAEVTGDRLNGDEKRPEVEGRWSVNNVKN